MTNQTKISIKLTRREWCRVLFLLNIAPKTMTDAKSIHDQIKEQFEKENQPMVKLIKGHWYLFNDRGQKAVGQYTGNDQGFECCVCGKGCKAHTFNVWYNETQWETWGYGNNHMPVILLDLGDKDDVIVNEEVING